MRRPPRAFTLVELLIVTAIIAMLVGLLAPALARAKELGRRAVCGSNQRQIVIGTTQWATDRNKGVFPKGALQLDSATVSAYIVYNAAGADNVDQGRFRAHGVPAGQGYISGKVLYCPSWRHPQYMYDQSPAGWPASNQLGASSVGAGYFSRVTFDTNRPANIRKDPGSMVAMVDGLSDVRMHHIEGFVCCKLDASSRFIADPSGAITTAAGSDTAYSSHETAYQTYFDNR